jgi:hypothetical protein
MLPPPASSWPNSLLQWITLTNKLDSKSRKELQDHYKASQKKKHECMLATKTKVIQKIMDNGGFTDDIENALAALTYAVESDVEDAEDTMPSGEQDEEVST